ncbi:GTP cyclohydrolase I [Streptococcus pyogenes]|nr:GTP cyclohydrolase I [Streptococcus pyogenes]
MKRERLMSINKEKAEAAIYQFLEAIGENPNREGLLDTPKRVAKMYAEMFWDWEKILKRSLRLSLKNNMRMW